MGGNGTNAVPLLQCNSTVRLPAPLRSLLTTVYPWLLAAILIIFVWQTVAARRATPPPPSSSDGTDELMCSTVVHDVILGMLPEASGLALSTKTPGVLWSMNDSGVPVVFPLDQMGRVLGRVRITGAEIDNWEDVTVAPCGSGSCLYVADTGNGGGTQRNDVVIYRVLEPSPTDTRMVKSTRKNAVTTLIGSKT